MCRRRLEYRREIETQANSYKAAFNLGRLYEQLGNRTEQEAAFKKSIEMNLRFAEGHFYLAKLYLDEGRQFDEAIELARRGLEVGGESEFAPLGHYVLADIYSRKGMQSPGSKRLEDGSWKPR